MAGPNQVPAAEKAPPQPAVVAVKPEEAHDLLERAEDLFEHAKQKAADFVDVALAEGGRQLRRAEVNLLKWLGSPGTKGDAGWALRDGAPPPQDATDAFRSLHAAARSGMHALAPDAKDFVYLLVPGLFTDHYPHYMKDNEHRLHSLGLDVRRVQMDSDDSVVRNAQRVRDAIEEASQTGKKVVLLGHSKGGVDAAAALSLYPELKPHVRALITMQAPFGGSALATDLLEARRLAPVVVRSVKRLLGGDPAAMADLTYEARKAFLKAHPFPSDIPTVCLASARYDRKSLLGPQERYLQKRYGYASDGLVVRDDAIIPGAKAIVLDDMDHAESALTGVKGFPNYWPGDVTEALINVALES